MTVRRALSLVMVLALISSLLPARAFAAAETDAAGWADDISGHWAEAAVDACHTYGIVSGYNGSFRPDDDITRAELAVMINRAFGYNAREEARETVHYADLAPDKWYTEDVQTLAVFGFIGDDGDGRIEPEAPITREQATVLLYQILRMTETGTDETRFTDMGGVSSTAAGAVLAMEQSGYIAGYNGRFMPQKNLSRGEAAQLLFNVFNEMIDGDLDAGGRTYRNAVVRKPGVVLQNAVIAGDLLITEGVGDGDVRLRSVHIDGRLLVTGGGENSIYLEDVTVGGGIVVDKLSAAGEQPVRIHIVQSNHTLVIYEGSAREIVVDNLDVIIDRGGGKTVLNIYESENEKPEVILHENASVGVIVVNMPARIGGSGTVSEIIIGAGGVEIDPELGVLPEDITIADGVYIIVEDGVAVGSTTDGSRNNIWVFEEAEYHTVTFDANGGEGEMEDLANIPHNSARQLPPNTFKLKDYAFNGWSADADGLDETRYPDGGDITVTSDITLYAQWLIRALKPIEVTFDAADMTLSNVTPRMSYSVDGGETWFPESKPILEEDIDVSHGIWVRDDGDWIDCAPSYPHKIELTRFGSPATVGATHETGPEEEDGSLTGVTAAMQYRLLPSGDWTDCGGTTVPDLAPGVYEVRYKGAGTVLPGLPATVRVKAWLTGAATITGTFEIGETLTVKTDGVTNALGDFSYQWKADGTDIPGATGETYTLTGADAGKTITCEVRSAETVGFVTATGEVVAYDIVVTMIEPTGADSLTALPTKGRQGDSVVLSYVLADIEDNNFLDIYYGSSIGERVNSAGADTINYTVSGTHAINGAITIRAIFTHTDKTIQTFSFAEESVTKVYGAAAFTNTFDNPGESTGETTYVSSNVSVATVDSSGSVIIVGVGTTDIIATKEGDVTYARAITFYTLTVDPKPLTITGVNATNRVYDGTISVELEGGALAGGLVGDDVVNFTLGRGTAASKDVGPQAVTTNITLDNPNYTLTQPTYVTVTITPKPLTITGVKGVDRAYNGSTTVALEGGTLVDVESDDIAGVGFDLGVGTAAGKDVDTWAVTTSITLNGEFMNNYELEYQPTDVTVNITPKPLTITGVAATTRTYDAKREVALTGGALVGVVDDEDVGFTLGEGTMADKSAGTGQAVTTSITLTDGTHSADNYELTQPEYVTVDIDKAPLTITGVTAVGRAYDGTTAVVLTGGKLEGVLTGDTVGFTLGSGTMIPNADAGDNKTVDTAIQLTGADEGNYELTQPTEDIIVDITRKSLTVNNVKAADRPYEPDNLDVELTGELVGVLTSIGDWVDFIGVGEMADTNAGSNKPVTSKSSLDGPTAHNYELTQPTGITVTISKADPVVSWPAIGVPYEEEKVLKLSDIPLGGYTNDPSGTFAWVNPDDEAGSVGDNLQHQMRFTPTDTDNYNVIYEDVTVMVGQIPAEVTAWPDVVTAYYGQTLSEVTISSGSSNTPGEFAWDWEDDEYNLDEQFSRGEKTRKMVFNPTDTAIYLPVQRDITFTVEKRPLTIEFTDILSPLNETAELELDVVGDDDIGLEMTAVTGLTWSFDEKILTVTYDGTTAFSSGSASLTFTTNNPNYTIEDPTPIQIRDGQSTDTAIPVRQDNVAVFNAYANTTAGLGLHYVQEEDITLTPPAEGDSNWTAIGSASTPFTGSYDGGGYVIENLVIVSTVDNQGLFGFVGSGGEVKNAGVHGNVNGGLDYGSAIGGIVGDNRGAVKNCYFTGSVEGFLDVGGVAGANSGTIENCYATGTVEGLDGVGGVVGTNTDTGIVKNCVALNTSVTGGHRVAGKSTGTLTNNYAIVPGTWALIGETTINGADITSVDDVRDLLKDCPGGVPEGLINDLLSSGNGGGRSLGRTADTITDETEPWKEPETVEVPGGGEETEEPDDDDGGDDDGDGEELTEGRMTVEEAIATLNNLLSMCSAGC
ncbi:MAG: YDG domain-containing protein [Oscillospiraceae bacterium]|nr:YDG domain-containing protein [Oscillospiraceae bacterium]